MNAAIVSLADLQSGTLCTITSIQLTGLLKRRIMDLGMVPGTTIQCIRKSPAGDPAAYSVRGSVIALRNDDAALIKVNPVKQ